MTRKPRTCVVICYWTGNPVRHLHRLLAQMQRVDSGTSFNVTIVCNGGLEKPLVLPSRFDDLRPRIINRENAGYNLAAWDVGWRDADYEFYLFLQAECTLRKANWLSDFEFRMCHDGGVGLLGEHMAWDRQSWDYIRNSTSRDLGESAASRVDTYKNTLLKAKIPIGEQGSYLVSVILFTRRKILEEVNGFPYIGPGYVGALASEIGFSKLIESKGYRLSTVRNGTHEVIGHIQWTKAGKLSLKTTFRRAMFDLWKTLPQGIREFLKKRCSWLFTVFGRSL